MIPTAYVYKALPPELPISPYHNRLLTEMRTHWEYGGPVLEGARQTRYPGVVGKTGVAVSGRQRGVKECLLRGVMTLCLALLRLRQGSGRGRRGRVSAAELREVT